MTHIQVCIILLYVQWHQLLLWKIYTNHKHTQEMPHKDCLCKVNASACGAHNWKCAIFMYYHLRSCYRLYMRLFHKQTDIRMHLHTYAHTHACTLMHADSDIPLNSRTVRYHPQSHTHHHPQCHKWHQGPPSDSVGFIYLKTNVHLIKPIPNKPHEWQPLKTETRGMHCTHRMAIILTAGRYGWDRKSLPSLAHRSI